MEKQHRQWILQPQKPHYRGITHNFVTSGSKIDFCHVNWRPSWIYANNKKFPKWAQGQPSWNCSRTPKEYKSSKNVIGKNIYRSHNEFVKRSNRLIVIMVMTTMCFRCFSGFESFAEGRCRDSKRQRDIIKSRDNLSANMNCRFAHTDCITTFF